MSTLIRDRRDGRGDTPPVDDGRLPPRPRRRWLHPGSAALLALVTCALGFYAGIRVEKSHAGGTTASPASAFAGRSGSAKTGSASAGAGGTSSGGGFAARFGGSGGPGGPGGGSVGTVASVDGRSLVLKEISGNTVKVKLTSATKVTKAKAVSRGEIHPGDTITVSGATGSQGTIAAASISDSGNSSSTSSSGSSGASGSSSSGSGSGVGSLFSSGG